jgi:hypothetical protein
VVAHDPWGEAQFGERPGVVVDGATALRSGDQRAVDRAGELLLGSALRLGDRLEPWVPAHVCCLLS